MEWCEREIKGHFLGEMNNNKFSLIFYLSLPHCRRRFSSSFFLCSSISGFLSNFNTEEMSIVWSHAMALLAFYRKLIRRQTEGKKTTTRNWLQFNHDDNIALALILSRVASRHSKHILIDADSCKEDDEKRERADIIIGLMLSLH